MKRLILILTIIILLALPAPLAIGTVPPIQETGSLNLQRFAQMPGTKVLYSGSVMFIQNVGQFDERALFQVWGGDKTIWLAEDGIWVTVLRQGSQGAEERGGVEARRPDALLHLRASASPLGQGVAIKLSFPGSNPHPRIEPFGQLETSVNYFIGNNPARWRTNVPVWAGVRYRDLYPSIDLELTGEGGRVVPRLVTQPGADLSAVRLLVEGADRVELLPAGESLRLTTAVGTLSLPLLTVEGWETRGPDVRRVGDRAFDIVSPFTFAPLHSSTPVLQQSSLSDQSQSDLLYASFLGGSGEDSGAGIVVDKNGYAYITGGTSSADFPTTPGAYDTIHNGDKDVFVAKLSPAGDQLVYSTFIGGKDAEWSQDLAVDTVGNVYIIGETRSTDFPTTPSAYDRTHNGWFDDFVVKLNASGTALVYATFLGTIGSEYGMGIAVDTDGNAYVTGNTNSNQFPTTSGAYDTTFNGSYDAFVAKLNSTGSTLLYSTFLGGSGYDLGSGIAVDSGGNAYIAGVTRSSDFPSTSDAYDGLYNGESDVFIAKLNVLGTELAYATFLGGSSIDYGTAIAIDGGGNAYATGWTSSENFPTTSGAYDTTYNGSDDAFAAELSASGGTLLYSTFLGGSESDKGYDITVGAGGNSYIVGSTSSANFPVTPDAYDPTPNGSNDVFVVKLNRVGTRLLYSTFLGGSSYDYGNEITVDEDGKFYITGGTISSDFPTTPGAYDATLNGQDAFVAKFALQPNLSCSAKQASTLQVIPGQVFTYTLSLSNCGNGDASRVRVTDTLPISLTYQAGSLWASAGTYGETGGVITWTGALAAEASAVVRFSAAVSPSLSPTETAAIVNVAQIDDGWHAPFGAAAVVFINPRQVYLPLVLRNR